MKLGGRMKGASMNRKLPSISYNFSLFTLLNFYESID
jgi:hypothetical protein